MNKYITTFIASMAMATVSQAAVEVSQSSSAPTENLIQYAEGYTASTLNWSAFGSVYTQWRDFGQTFLAPGDLQLEAFTFALDSFETQAQGAAFTVKIFETTEGGTPLQNGSLLSTQFGVLPGTLVAGQYMTFSLDSAVSLSSGRYYTVMLHFDEYHTATAPNRRLMKFKMGGVVGENPLGAGSYYWQSSTSNPSEYVKGNMILTSYFHGTSIPEPGSTAMLLGAGVLAAGVFILRGARSGKEYREEECPHSSID